MQHHSNRENRESPSVSESTDSERIVNVPDGKTNMHADGKSDGPIVPPTTANKSAAEAPAEPDEGRGPTKRNAKQTDLPRTPSRTHDRSGGLQGVRRARKDSTLKFTALLHHVNEDCLTEAFFQLKKLAAVGVDGVSWHDYERNLEANITDLIGFENHSEAVACLDELRTRFAKHGLKLHDGKTRLIEFGRFAIERRASRGKGRPETFDFLGFTHMCAKTRKNGWFTIHRQTIAKRMRATLKAISLKLRRRMHRPTGETGHWLRSVVQGWMNYHAVPNNTYRVARFISEVTRIWLANIRRRSQKGRRGWTWERMQRYAQRYLPRPRVLHPYPNDRFRAKLKVGAV
jgi:hypothetical protein